MNEERLARKREYSKAQYAAMKAADPEGMRERARIKARERRKRYREKMRLYDRERYQRRREQHREGNRKRYATNANGYRDKAIALARARYLSGRMYDRLRCALNAARHRAKKRGIEFNLTLADLGEPTHCAVTGIEFDMTRSFNEGNIFVPSLDRIEPKLGYVRGNIRVVCHGYNLAKHTGTDSDVLKLARALVKAFPE